MAKSLKEQIEQVRRDEERIAEAAKRRAESIGRIVAPIAEKAAAAVRARVEEELKADLAKAELIDLGRDSLKDAAEAFWVSATKGAAKAVEAKPSRAKSASSAIQAAGGVSIED